MTEHKEIDGLQKLIDCSDDEFKEAIKDKNLGYIQSLMLIFEDTFLSLAKLFSEYDIKKNTTTDEATLNKIDEAMANIFGVMTKLEIRQSVLIEEKNKRYDARNVVSEGNKS